MKVSPGEKAFGFCAVSAGSILFWKYGKPRATSTVKVLISASFAVILEGTASAAATIDIAAVVSARAATATFVPDRLPFHNSPNESTARLARRRLDSIVVFMCVLF